MQHLLDKSTCRYITIIINALMREMWAYNIYKWYNHFIFTFRLHQTEYCTPVCIRYRYSIETNQFCYYEIECWTLCAFSMNLNKFRNLFGETLRGVDPYIYSSLIERFNSAYYEFISHNVVVFLVKSEEQVFTSCYQFICLNQTHCFFDFYYCWGLKVWLEPFF